MLADHYNPDHIQFQDVPRNEMCSCAHPCRVSRCANADANAFCDVYCCPYSGLCGNGLEPSRCLGLMKNLHTGEYTVIATHAIDKDVVIGEYLGRMKERFSADERPHNPGFRFYMHHDPEHAAGERVCIDAQRYGNMLRFVNHSCFANCRFKQVANGLQHTVVMVTNRALQRGDEVLVDYGNEVWFPCTCGEERCRHRQDGNDADPFSNHLGSKTMIARRKRPFSLH